MQSHAPTSKDLALSLSVVQSQSQSQSQQQQWRVRDPVAASRFASSLSSFLRHPICSVLQSKWCVCFLSFLASLAA